MGGCVFLAEGVRTPSIQQTRQTSRERPATARAADAVRLVPVGAAGVVGAAVVAVARVEAAVAALR
jgi:hypothetical protein